MQGVDGTGVGQWVSMWGLSQVLSKTDTTGLISARSAILRSLEGRPASAVELRICRAGGVSLHATEATKPCADLCAIPWALRERIIRRPRTLFGADSGLRKGSSTGERYVMCVLHTDDALRQRISEFSHVCILPSGGGNQKCGCLAALHYIYLQYERII